MAYVNVMEWRAEQVADWLQGLDDSVCSYAHFFLNNNVTGQHLLNLTVDDLFKLHVEKLGHQEIILEALELLKNLHYNLDTENLQYVCLRLSCKARSLWNEIRMAGLLRNQEEKQMVSNQMMAACADVLDSLQALISWLDRHPFCQYKHYTKFKWDLLKISIELATNTIRDRFAERPIRLISDSCKNLADMSDTLIQDCQDPLFLQPAYLDVSTTKRKADEDDFGILLETHFSGAHLIQDVRFGSLAYQYGRIGIGDEIVQINYQTVVGWQLKKVLKVMEENPSELIITIKKIPKVIGQIYIKPFRIPARQKNPKNHFNNLPSPRAELLNISSLNFPSIKCPLNTDPGLSSDEEGSMPINIDTSDLDVDDPQSLVDPSELDKSPTQSIRSVFSRLSRPRSAPQRRNTISGTSPTHERAYINLREIWEHRNNRSGNPSNPSSNHSTLQSKDSGLSTMSSHLKDEEAEMRQRTGEAQANRPVTVAEFNIQSQKRQRGSYMNVPGTGSRSFDCPRSSTNLSLDSGYGQSVAADEESRASRNSSQRNPMPNPRVGPSPNRKLDHRPHREPSVKKRPIPQPRRIQNNPIQASPTRKTSSGQDSSYESEHSTPPTPSSLTKSLRSLLPESVKGGPQVVPVPTSNFKSFKRVTPSPSPSGEGKRAPQHQLSPPPTPARGGSSRPSLPEYVNTTPPVIPARAKCTNMESPPPKKLPQHRNNMPLPSTAPPPRPQKPGPVREPPHHPEGESEVVLRPKKVMPSSTPSCPSNKAPSPRHGIIGGVNQNLARRSSNTSSQGGDRESRRSSFFGEKIATDDSDGYREGSSEKNWIDSLRRNKEAAKVVTSSPSSETTSPQVPQRSSELRSAQSYQPLPQYLVGSNQEDAHTLKYAFDLDLTPEQRPQLPLPTSDYVPLSNHRALMRDRRLDSDDEHEYSQLSEMTSSPSPTAGKPAPVAPPMQPLSPGRRPMRAPAPTPPTNSTDLPPLFNPSSYTIQDIKQKKQP
eukprot:maker-scaffold68_size422247-snap-gene-0.11 protein:Tk11381 transcript:maker-scaffold68_size422247-snap-gene-0.11-mRNA-1 annotation:"hypothetical protein Phum_PHUM140130"